MSQNFEAAAQQARTTLNSIYSSGDKADKGQAEAILAHAYAMHEVAQSIESIASAIRNHR